MTKIGKVLYFWDWQQAMGGTCSMVRFVDRGKAMAGHVPMRSAGYHETAGMLFDQLMQAYDAYRKDDPTDCTSS